jgi:ABC-2 type transport system permease protein
MNTKKMFAVMKRDYLERVRSKSFIIGTILGPVMLLALIIVPVMVTKVEGGKQKKIAVIDMSGEVYGKLQEHLSSGKLAKQFLLLRITATDNDLQQKRQQLVDEILADKLDGYVYINKDILAGGTPEYHSKHVSNFIELRSVEDAITRIIVEKKLKSEGLDPAKIQEITKTRELKVIKIAKQGKESEERGETIITVYILMLMIYTTLIMYGVSVMRSVIEDKNSRIVEILASSVKPFELMMGKLFGVGAVGLTQYLIWVVCTLLVVLYGSSMFVALSHETSLANFLIPIPVLIFFIIYFILGYFLYSTMYIAVGAMVNSEQDAQNLQFPIVSFLIVPIALAPMIMMNPNSSAAVILSLIPFFTPILMFMRITVLMPPALEIAASILIMIFTIILMIWLTSRIYRVGILMYGKRPTAAELLKWIRRSS